jgi:hypothetical protein
VSSDIGGENFALVKVKQSQRSDYIKKDCHLLAGINVVNLGGG